MQYNVNSNACYVMMSVFVWRPESFINKSRVSTVHAHENCHINTRLCLD